MLYGNQMKVINLSPSDSCPNKEIRTGQSDLSVGIASSVGRRSPGGSGERRPESLYSRAGGNRRSLKNDKGSRSQ